MFIYLTNAIVHHLSLQLELVDKMRTSYKKNRPFDFKLIENVEPNPVLYKRQAGLSNYDVMKVKSEIWTKIAKVMKCEGNAQRNNFIENLQLKIP